MKIEKINENKFRCILTKQDLDDRQIRISELAYGTDKAKALFRDLMQQASFEFGFEADDIPLMIEAIPTPSESLVLVITKVEDPDELDTRFSKFSPEESDMDEEYEDIDAYADEILSRCGDETTALYEEDEEDNEDWHSTDMSDTATEENDDFISLPKALGMEQPKKHYNKPATESKHINIIKVFMFPSLEDIITLASNFVYSYRGKNTIYKDEASGNYYLVTEKSDHTPEQFNKICNSISEYGKPVRTTYASISYYEEHLTVIIRDKALQTLASI